MMIMHFVRARFVILFMSNFYHGVRLLLLGCYWYMYIPLLMLMRNAECEIFVM